MRKNKHFDCGLNSIYFGFCCSLISFIIIGLSTATYATQSNCISKNVGEIRDRHGRTIPGASGIAQRAPGDVYLVSDKTNILYHARLSDGRWKTDHYGIDSEGTGPNRESIPDIEDIAYGPCPNISEGQCIFIGQIGGNRPLANKNTFSIHYIRERDMVGQRGRYVRTTKIRYRYPNGGKFDAEGLAVHPRTGELFVVTKTRGSTSYIYKFHPRFPNRPPKLIAKINLSELFRTYKNNTNVRQITGLAISPDGSRFVIVTYESLVEFNIDISSEENLSLPGHTPTRMRSLLGGRWLTARDLRRAQIEAITYDGSNSRFVIIGEGDPNAIALDCSGQEQPVAGHGRCVDPSIPVDAFLTGYDRLYGGGHTSIPMKGEYACTGAGTYSRVTPLRIIDYQCDSNFTNCRQIKVKPVTKMEIVEDKIIYWVSDTTWYEKKLKTPENRNRSYRQRSYNAPADADRGGTNKTSTDKGWGPID